MEEMDQVIRPVTAKLSIDLVAAKKAYLQFHREEKPELFAATSPKREAPRLLESIH